MKMEFEGDEENAGPVEEVGLAARLSKKTKTLAKETGETDCSCTVFIVKQVSENLVYRTIQYIFCNL